MVEAPLRLSVIVPARDCAPFLETTLAALRRSDLRREDWELIVVDDGSRDATLNIARAAADHVEHLTDGPHGPAHARNRGAECAAGRYLAFIDADVRVHAGTLSGLVERLDADPGLGAVFGAYDTEPLAGGIVSQYRNLVHHWVHHRNAGEAHTFWAGCGAVRADAFRRVGGFDAKRFPIPQIEDIELGHRLRDDGWRILLDPRLQGTHLKRWTFLGGIITDIRDRGVPWARLLMTGDQGKRASALNLHPAEKLATALICTALVLVIVTPLTTPALGIAAAVAAAAGLVPSVPLLVWLARLRGIGFALAAVPLRLLYYVSNGISMVVAALLHTFAPRSARRASTTHRLHA